MTKTTKLKTMLLTLLLCLVGVSEMQAYGIYCSVSSGKGKIQYAKSKTGKKYDAEMDAWTWSVSGKLYFYPVAETGYTFDHFAAGNQANKYTQNPWEVDILGNKNIYVYFNANNYRLYFDANGGTLTATGNFSHGTSGVYDNNTKGYVQVTYDSSNYFKMDGNPTRTGYTFAGWYSAASGGTQVYTAGGVCTNWYYWSGNAWRNAGDGTVYAHWTGNQYTLTFDTNGGTISNYGNLDSNKQLKVTYGDHGNCFLNTRVVKEGYVFDGWYDAAEGGNQVYDAGCCAVKGTYWSGACTGWENTWTNTLWQHLDNVTLYAHWKERTYVDVNSVAQNLSVTDFTAYAPTSNPIIKSDIIGSFTQYLYLDINMKVKAGDYKLSFKSSLSYTSDGSANISLAANDDAAISPSGDFTIPNINSWTLATPHEYNITGLTDGGMYVRLLSNGNTTTSHIDCGNMGDFVITKTKGFAYFDANGGTCSTTQKSLAVGEGCTFGELPIPTYDDNHTFLGWYDGDTEVTKETAFNRVDNPTLKAQWREISKIDSEGAVTYNDVEVTPEKVAEDIADKQGKEEATTKTAFDFSKATVTKENAQEIVKKIRETKNSENAFVFLPKVEGLENSVIETPNVITVEESGDAVCHKLELVDNTPMVTALVGKKFTAANATYSRDVKNVWGTICLPYAVSSDKTIQYYKLNNVDTENGVMSFTAVDKVEANTPAVFRKSEKGVMTPTASDIEVSVQKSENNTGDTWYLVGTYKGLTLTNEQTSNNYYIASNKFWCTSQASSSVSIPAYRAYFTTTKPQEAKRSFSIAIWDGDSATAIGTIDANGEVQITDGKYMQNSKVTIVKNGRKYNAAGAELK